MILVTGATGSNGGEVLKLLSRLGIPLRAMVRSTSRQPNDLSRSVEFVTADFDDDRSIARALEGIERAFLVTNSSERTEEQQLRFVERARSAGVRHIVYLSQLHAARNSPVRFLHYHAVVEEAIASSGMAFTHLRPNLYMQGLLGFRSSIQAEGRIMAPAGDAPVSIVDVRDIAGVAVAVLTQHGHDRRICDITGPESLTHAELASQLSGALGKPIAFVDIPESAMRSALLSFGFPEWQADGLVEDYAHYRRGEASAVSRTVQDVTGLPSRTFRNFADDYKHAFLN
jgi:uncharacterized protein YbjT (DUF2867 family)